jgi:hypothetical protein
MNVRKEYARRRALGWTAIYALQSAKTAARFDELKWDDRVRFRVEPDHSPYEHGDMGPKFEAETNARIERDGLWGIIAEYRCPHCGAWTVADAVWGFVGLDWLDSGYDTDVKQSAIDALEGKS